MVYSKILVTGGAGFVGSHIANRLVDEGFEVLVLDNLSSGKLRNLEDITDKKNLHFIKGDIRDFDIVRETLSAKHSIASVRYSQKQIRVAKF